ncbi:MAG: ACT domain-containing protein [Planctomycetota bacterium]|jgi:glycine cleavage system regulatory protein
MPAVRSSVQHAALWLIGPDMPGLLNLGSKFVADRGGNIDKDIADKFGEKAVVFMSITAAPEDIERMDHEKDFLKKASGCGVVFQPMQQPIVPDGFQDELYGFDILTKDAPGLIAELTGLVSEYGILIVGHTGERHVIPGPTRRVEAGQKYVVMLPRQFDRVGFTRALSELVKRYDGVIKTPLLTVPGLLWWW